MVSLKSSLDRGLRCLVITSNPEETKLQFERITGVKLTLNKLSEGSIIYNAILN